jgi:hypothetical protein
VSPGPLFLQIKSATSFAPAEYRVTVAMPGRVGRTYGGPIERRISTAGFGLSDIVLSDPMSSTSWVRNGYTLSPTFAVVAGSKVNEYYEVYGATKGNSLRTTITVASGGGLLRGRRTQRITFDEIADAPMIPVMRKVALPDSRGTLDKTVEVLNRRTGEKAERQVRVTAR